jgi:Uma2 family endonuclease
VQTLLLAIEVLSPSSARADRIVKRRLYQRQGVETYWIVDPDAALVEVWHPSDERPEIVTEVLRWHGESRADAFEMNLSSLFGDLPR